MNIENKIEYQGVRLLEFSQQTVDEKTSVVLDASGSSDPDGTITDISWFQSGSINEPSVTLVNADTLTPTLIAPAVASDQTVTIGLRLTDNRGFNTTRYTTVTITNVLIDPTANAGPDITLESTVANPIQLDGSLSSDSDGTIVSYLWSQAFGQQGVVLSNANTATATATLPALTLTDQYSFSLTVTDNDGLTHTDTIVVNP